MCLRYIQRNIRAEPVPFVLFFLVKEINKPRLDTIEGAEHNFGILRTVIRVFTQMEFLQLIEKTTGRLKLIFCNGFGTFRYPQKGYASTFMECIDLSLDESLPAMDGSVVIDPNGSLVVEQM